MAETAEYKHQLNIKFGDELLNIRGDSVEDLLSEVGKLTDHKMILITAAQEFRAAANVAAQFPGTAQASPPQEMSPWPAGSTPAPPPPQAQPAYGVKVCAHNLPYVFKSGTNAQGKAWSGQFCQAPGGKDQQCQPIWSGR